VCQDRPDAAPLLRFQEQASVPSTRSLDFH
jgi:hypothetical protein